MPTDLQAQAIAAFQMLKLGLRVRLANGDTNGPEEGEVFTEKHFIQPSSNFIQSTANSTAWIRFNYFSETRPTAHAVHCGLWENVIVIVHYQFLTRDYDEFAAGREPIRNYLNQRLIRSSVSLY